MKLDTTFRAYYKLKRSTTYLVFLPGFMFGTNVVTVDFSLPTPNTVQVVIYKGQEDEHGPRSVMEFNVSDEMSQTLHMLHDAWSMVKRDVWAYKQEHSYEHPAVILSYCSDDLIGAYISRSYLEKSEIRFWKLSDIMNMKNPEQQFRVNFLGLLSAIDNHICK